jgi:hypothetical protein
MCLPTAHKKASSGSPISSIMPRPFRAVMLVGLLVLLFVTLRAGVLPPRECLASLGLGQAPPETDRKAPVHKTRVDVYDSSTDD